MIVANEVILTFFVDSRMAGESCTVNPYDLSGSTLGSSMLSSDSFPSKALMKTFITVDITSGPGSSKDLSRNAFAAIGCRPTARVSNAV